MPPCLNLYTLNAQYFGILMILNTLLAIKIATQRTRHATDMKLKRQEEDATM